MFIEQVPLIVRWIYPRALWRINPKERAVYLTFDDGPIPQITPWVLDLLDKYGIKATFFMVGENAYRYPQLLELVRSRGHRIGNHTYNHLSGIRHLTPTYLQNADKANCLLQTDLFRPPHGFMRWMQYGVLKRKYRIVMWDVVTRDYNPTFTPQQVLANVKRYVRPGSIITFHDSIKSFPRLEQALPQAIEWLREQGYVFKLIE